MLIVCMLSGQREVRAVALLNELGIHKGKETRKDVRASYWQKLEPTLSSLWPNSKAESIEP